MKKVVFAIMSMGFLFVGCSTLTIEEQIQECKDSGKRYVIAEKMNFRTGEMEKYVQCK